MITVRHLATSRSERIVWLLEKLESSPRDRTLRPPAGEGLDAASHVKQAGLFTEAEDGRAALLARWRALTRDVLPGMAEAQGWPIRLDHCFMRVCLDAALGAPWTARVKAPAVRHMSDGQLAAAVRIAERVARDPGLLPPLDRASIAGRREMRKR